MKKIIDFPVEAYEGMERVYTLQIPETWAPSSEVRWLGRQVPTGFKSGFGQPLTKYQKVLQQRWVHYTGGVAGREEWRDVPTVEG